jgi:hypothetical protein
VGILLNVSQHASGSLDVGLMESVKARSKGRKGLNVATAGTVSQSRY